MAKGGKVRSVWHILAASGILLGVLGATATTAFAEKGIKKPPTPSDTVDPCKLNPDACKPSTGK